MADKKDNQTYSVDHYDGSGHWDGWSQVNPSGRSADHYNGSGHWDGWSQANPSGGVDHYDGNGHWVGSSLPDRNSGGPAAASGGGAPSSFHTYSVSPLEKKLLAIQGRLSILGYALYILGLAYAAAVMIFPRFPQSYLPAACVLGLTLIAAMYLISAANTLPGFGGLFLMWILTALANHVLSMFRAWNEYGLTEKQMLTITGVGAGAAILIMLLCAGLGRYKRRQMEKRILGYRRSTY